MDISKSSLRRLSAGFLRPLLLLALLLGASLAAISAVHADGSEDESSDTSPALTSAASFTTPLSGRVYVWDRGRLLPVEHARVATGSALVRTDALGRFEFPADERTGTITVVQPGFDTVRRPVYRDQSVIVLRNLVVRAIFVPLSLIDREDVQDFVYDLVDRNLINAVVIDLKDEGGQVIPFAATDTVRRMNAHRHVPNERTTEFLDRLASQGVYRIGRIVTFKDPWFADWHNEHALKSREGGLFVDTGGGFWSSPFSYDARRYNIDIGVAAADYVEEVQYDYVRLPTEDGVLERTQFTASDRVATINRFAQEAGDALHRVGVAVSFDLFGVVSTAGNDQGIGQSVAGVAPYIDYVSPMVYPSGWHAGSFGYAYPPAHPGPVVRANVQATLDLILEDGSAVVRPWLQDFTDYQERGLYYTAERVHAQIAATADAGGIGFMLWDPSLQYQLDALEQAHQLIWPTPN